MRAAVFVIAAIVAGVAVVRLPTAPRPSEHAGPVRPSRHAAPPEDVLALNAAGPRHVPAALRRMVLPDHRPAVVMFLKAGCGCSEDFARLFTTIEPQLAPRASCLAVIEAADGDAAAFLESTGLAAAHLVQSDGSLAAEWGVTKAGCVALVRPDGTVEAVWPGISRQGFRDLAGRLGDVNLLHPDSLALLPGAATAGCPL